MHAARHCGRRRTVASAVRSDQDRGVRGGPRPRSVARSADAAHPAVWKSPRATVLAIAGRTSTASARRRSHRTARAASSRTASTKFSPRCRATTVTSAAMPWLIHMTESATTASDSPADGGSTRGAPCTCGVETPRGRDRTQYEEQVEQELTQPDRDAQPHQRELPAGKQHADHRGEDPGHEDSDAARHLSSAPDVSGQSDEDRQ